AALFVRLARSDEDYDASEKILINKMLQFRYDLALDKAEALRIEAEELESKAPDTVRFTRLIKESVAYEDRQSV
ncbi:MAG: TerB family tellurite resistance protein, partial [Rhodobacterales bacterium]